MPVLSHVLSSARHGDYMKWRAALADLPVLAAENVELTDTVTVNGPVSAAERGQLEAALRLLHPWRKGPFRLFGVKIDTEWRSDWKWQRLAPHLQDLSGEAVLDVGCGNGYFGWRMLEAGARRVVGVDPSVLFHMQHRAINHFLRSQHNWLVPLAFEQLPPAAFDTVISMGVIYHRRDPVEHCQRLFAFTRPGGRVVLESLVASSPAGLTPEGRYARMRNVWQVPSTSQMCRWLEACGFSNTRTVDLTPTTIAEQRATGWMQFESLAEALDPADPSLTVEGHPAPVRAIVVARRPT